MTKLIEWLNANLFGILKCPKCGRWISWNDGWNKWDNCEWCGFNPNYKELDENNTKAKKYTY